MRVPVNKQGLLYPELSYEIIGCAYEVHNELGGGLLEKVYQKAMAVAFKQKNLQFEEQAHHPITFGGEKVGVGYFDFLVESTVVVELKRTNHFSRKQMEQVSAYLQQSNLKLGILIHFGQEEVRFKRVVNEK